MIFVSTPLNSNHNRDVFSCGKASLDNYLKYQVTQDIKRKLAACFINAEKNGSDIKGFYTLSGSSIKSEYIPEELKRKIPLAYIDIPVTLMGRFAIDLNYQGRGLGKELLIDALRRIYYASLEVGSFAAVVDPLDMEAAAFYHKFGFINLPGSEKMFLLTKTISKIFIK